MRKIIKYKRSPLFYVGDKYKLISQIVKLFPQHIDSFYEPFVGGGSVFLNVKAKRYLLNDIDSNLISIHKYLQKKSNTPHVFFHDIETIAKEFNLSRSNREDVIPGELKINYKKTYYARYNKKGYEKLREYYNGLHENDPLLLYVLLIYGFNRMLRFNRNGSFNLPVGNVDFNKNVEEALIEYFNTVKGKRIKYYSMDFRKFLANRKYEASDFIYFDPPYLITFSEYNKLWNKDNERHLLKLLDILDKKNVKFALSNVTHYNGDVNKVLIKWMKNYNVHKIRSNYISYHNNSTKKQISEVLITNYE